MRVIDCEVYLKLDLEILGYVGALICRLFDYNKVEIIVVKICKWLRVS